MQKKDYRKPETVINRFDAVDVITTSGFSTGGSGKPNKPGNHNGDKNHQGTGSQGQGGGWGNNGGGHGLNKR